MNSSGSAAEVVGGGGLEPGHAGFHRLHPEALSVTGPPAEAALIKIPGTDGRSTLIWNAGLHKGLTWAGFMVFGQKSTCAQMPGLLQNSETHMIPGIGCLPLNGVAVQVPSAIFPHPALLWPAPGLSALWIPRIWNLRRTIQIYGRAARAS